jgi:PAS domain S-box-containing protein
MARIALAAIAAPPARRYALAIALALAAIGLRRALDPLWGSELPLIFFFPAVMVSAWLGGAVAGTITTLICAVAARYLWIPPIHSWAIPPARGLLGLLVFVAVGTVISVFNEMWRRGAAALVASERIAQELAAIVEWSDDAIMSKDLDSTIRSWNRGAERMFGYSAAEAIGQSMRLIIPLDRWAEEEEVMRRLRRGETVDHFETMRCRRDASEVPISLTISPIVDAAGVVVGASTIARDISVRRQAQQTERDGARLKDEFLAIVSHELRTPVNAMLAGRRCCSAPMWTRLVATAPCAGSTPTPRDRRSWSKSSLTSHGRWPGSCDWPMSGSSCRRSSATRSRWPRRRRRRSRPPCASRSTRRWDQSLGIRFACNRSS